MKPHVVAAYCAVDAGPRETLQAIASRLPGYWVEESDEAAGIEHCLQARSTDILVVGSSDTGLGRRRESAARRAASAFGIACVVVEDFPGNYYDVPPTAPAAIVVDCEPAKEWARKKMQSTESLIYVCPAIRYDALRRRLAELRKPRKAANAVLWIGQPETKDCMATLAHLIPELKRQGVRLWFRAHPRDAGYEEGVYREILAAADDLTREPLEACLQRAPRLVITQFSSVAIEAGFWGIPALHAVFSEVGGARLLAKKGYSVPPWCEVGAAFELTNEAKVAETLDKALRSDRARASVIARFDEWFCVTEEAGPRLIKLLYNQGLLKRYRPS